MQCASPGSRPKGGNQETQRNIAAGGDRTRPDRTASKSERSPLEQHSEAGGQAKRAVKPRRRWGQRGPWGQRWPSAGRPARGAIRSDCYASDYLGNLLGNPSRQQGKYPRDTSYSCQNGRNLVINFSAVLLPHISPRFPAWKSIPLADRLVSSISEDLPFSSWWFKTKGMLSKLQKISDGLNEINPWNWEDFLWLSFL